MVLLDTDIFVIDRFFQRDVRYPTNQALIDCLPRIDAGFSAFSLFELCGIASFRMSPAELRRWSYNFDEVYGVKVLEPKGIDIMLAMSWFARFSYRVLGIYERKMTWEDAVLLLTAEDYGAEAILTWNKRHFEGRTVIKVLTPDEYLTTP
ncbi:MAG: hypothetical protein CVU38_00150 [Chloroflexi bacterium HGW-Chloroflexi-1]|nr:MAG: hypothetical protein CVU38_00150 [Chloroflexi bacterium HGW-Chloroflexi-1]